MNDVLKKFDVAGRSAIVTGATSGIGLAYAEALAGAGVMVTVASIDKGRVQETVRAFEERGWNARGAVVDVADHKQVACTVDDHVAAWGGLDIAFVNAGIGAGHGYLGGDGKRDPRGQVDTFDLADWDRNISVNLSGAFYTIREAARVMKKAGRGGSIVVTTSNASTITVPIVNASYMAAKAGLAHLVRQLALELAAYKIRVNSIAPGSFVTNIGGGVLKDPAVRAIWAKAIPLGDMGMPEQIKALALYLASDASDFVTGTEMVIDGGVSLGMAG